MQIFYVREVTYKLMLCTLKGTLPFVKLTVTFYYVRFVPPETLRMARFTDPIKGSNVVNPEQVITSIL